MVGGEISELEEFFSKASDRDTGNLGIDNKYRLCHWIERAAAYRRNGRLLVSDFLVIYGLKDTWICIGSAVLVVCVWLFFASALTLPVPVRAILLWSLLFVLCLIAPERR